MRTVKHKEWRAVVDSVVTAVPRGHSVSLRNLSASQLCWCVTGGFAFVVH